MTLSSRSIVVISFILLIASLGCEQKRNNMRISSWVSSPEETRLFESTLDSFGVHHPSVEFDFEPIPGNYSEKLQLMLGTNTGPDLFFVKGYIAPSYMSFEILEPLNEYILNTPEFDTDDFFPNLINAFNRDGTQYGLPKDFAPYVMFYNEDLFAQAGLDSVPTTWEELESFAAELTKDTDGDGKVDQYGLVI